MPHGRSLLCFEACSRRSFTLLLRVRVYWQPVRQMTLVLGPSPVILAVTFFVPLGIKIGGTSRQRTPKSCLKRGKTATFNTRASVGMVEMIDIVTNRYDA